jgi:CRISPR type III-B/RAMP module-associated protein Cmr3
VSQASVATTSAWLAFTPRDTVFVRDGRSFDAVADAFAQAVRPGPTTIAGAVGAAFDGPNPAEVRGPVLARRAGAGWEPYFPVPADLVVTAGRAGRVYRLSPESLGRTDLEGDVGDNNAVDGVTSPQMLVPPEHADPVTPVGGELPGQRLMPGRVLLEYLAGRLPGERGIPLRNLELAEPLAPEQRVGLARAGRRAREGFLYQAVHLRPGEDWAFLAEYGVGEQWAGVAKDHVPFGGRGRLADIQPAAMRWPDATQTIGKRVLVYLATAAVWRDGWRMPVPDEATLVAAATYEPEPVATVRPGRGWRDTRALRWAVPAGSVYLLEFGTAAAGAAWARAWNGVALDRGGRHGEEDLPRTAGFGVVLTGAWT